MSVLHATAKSDMVTLPLWRKEYRERKEATRDAVSALCPEAISQWLGESKSVDTLLSGRAWPWIEDGKKEPW